MNKHLSDDDKQVVADEAAAEKVYQAGKDKDAKEVASASSQLPYQTQQVLAAMAKSKVEVKAEPVKEK